MSLRGIRRFLFPAVETSRRLHDGGFPAKPEVYRDIGKLILSPSVPATAAAAGAWSSGRSQGQGSGKRVRSVFDGRFDGRDDAL